MYDGQKLNSVAYLASLNPHMETRSKRDPKMENSLMWSKLKAREGTRGTVTSLIQKLLATDTPSNEFRETANSST